MTGVLAGSAASWISGRGQDRVGGWLLAAFERVRHGCRGGDLRGGLGHAGGLLVAGFLHLGVRESGQVAVDEHVVGSRSTCRVPGRARRRSAAQLSARRAGSESSKPTTRVMGWAAPGPGGPGQQRGPARRVPVRPGQPVPARPVSAGAGRRSAVTRIRPAMPATAQAARTRRTRRWHVRRSRRRCGWRRPLPRAAEPGTRTRRKPGVKLARLAAPPLTGIPNTMNASTATATSGGQIRPVRPWGRRPPARTARRCRRSPRSCPGRRCHPRSPRRPPR